LKTRLDNDGFAIMEYMRTDAEIIHRRIADLLNSRKRFVLATIVETKGSTPQEAGAKMIILSDGSFDFTIGGGTFEAEVIQDALSTLSKNSTEIREYKLTKSELGMYCQGLVRVMLEVCSPRPQMLILGGGHVGQALSRITAATGIFRVVVADDRKEYANRKKHPAADLVVLTDRDYQKGMPDIDSETYVVIVTRCHATDKVIIKNLSDKKTAYIGLIGSKPKIKQFYRELLEEGVSSRFLDSIHAPIGISIGGKEPAEVALSILAQVVQVKNSTSAAETTLTVQKTIIK
jgi:xanthine dehydrogenase accessory factor